MQEVKKLYNFRHCNCFVASPVSSDRSKNILQIAVADTIETAELVIGLLVIPIFDVESVEQSYDYNLSRTFDLGLLTFTLHRNNETGEWLIYSFD